MRPVSQIERAISKRPALDGAAPPKLLKNSVGAAIPSLPAYMLFSRAILTSEPLAPAAPAEKPWTERPWTDLPMPMALMLLMRAEEEVVVEEEEEEEEMPMVAPVARLLTTVQRCGSLPPSPSLPVPAAAAEPAAAEPAAAKPPGCLCRVGRSFPVDPRS